MFEGRVHMRRVPVIIEAATDSRVALSGQESWSMCANNLPAPADRRRLPVNRVIDIVGMDKVLRSQRRRWAQKSCYTWPGTEAQSLFQSETSLMAHMRSARDLRMMIHEILNVNNVFYSK